MKNIITEIIETIKDISEVFYDLFHADPIKTFFMHFAMLIRTPINTIKFWKSYGKRLSILSTLLFLIITAVTFKFGVPFMVLSPKLQEIIPFVNNGVTTMIFFAVVTYIANRSGLCASSLNLIITASMVDNLRPIFISKGLNDGMIGIIICASAFFAFILTALMKNMYYDRIKCDIRTFDGAQNEEAARELVDLCIKDELRRKIESNPNAERYLM